MTRTLFLNLLFVLFMTACGKSNRAAYEYPKTLSSGYELLQQQTLSPSAAPETIRSLAIQNVWKAKYKSATGSASVTVYETAANAVAFEALQKWRHAKGEMTFHQGIDFVVIESPDLNMQQLEVLSNAIGMSMQGRGK